MWKNFNQKVETEFSLTYYDSESKSTKIEKNISKKRYTQLKLEIYKNTLKDIKKIIFEIEKMPKSSKNNEFLNIYNNKMKIKNDFDKDFGRLMGEINKSNKSEQEKMDSREILKSKKDDFYNNVISEISKKYLELIYDKNKFEKISKIENIKILNMKKYIYTISVNENNEEEIYGYMEGFDPKMSGRPAHSELSEGRPVITAGELIVKGIDKDFTSIIELENFMDKTKGNVKYEVSEMNNGSGHYRPTADSLETGIEIMNNNGINPKLLKNSLQRTYTIHSNPHMVSTTKNRSEIKLKILKEFIENLNFNIQYDEGSSLLAIMEEDINEELKEGVKDINFHDHFGNAINLLYEIDELNKDENNTLDKIEKFIKKVDEIKIVNDLKKIQIENQANTIIKISSIGYINTEKLMEEKNSVGFKLDKLKINKILNISGKKISGKFIDIMLLTMNKNLKNKLKNKDLDKMEEGEDITNEIIKEIKITKISVKLLLTKEIIKKDFNIDQMDENLAENIENIKLTKEIIKVFEKNNIKISNSNSLVNYMNNLNNFPKLKFEILEGKGEKEDFENKIIKNINNDGGNLTEDKNITVNKNEYENDFSL